MSKNETKDSYSMIDTDNDDNQKEEELIIKYTEDIKNEETRSKAIEILYQYARLCLVGGIICLVGHLTFFH